MKKLIDLKININIRSKSQQFHKFDFNYHTNNNQLSLINNDLLRFDQFNIFLNNQYIKSSKTI